VRNKILTKDNLKKLNWHGSCDCCFCGCNETVDHLFFKCSVARYVWRVIQVALHLDFIPKNIKELFDIWMKGPKNKITNMFLFGCGAVLWAIWRTRNDWCFGDKTVLDSSNVIFFAASSWIPGLFGIKRRKKDGGTRKQAHQKDGK
jgi:hypothetical protein